MSRANYAQLAKNRSLGFYCNAIPYSFTKPAFDAAIEAAPSGGLFLVDFGSPDVMALNLRGISPIDTYKCQDFSKNLYCDTNESFWFAVDKNGVVRMSGFPPLSNIFNVFGGTVLPYLFGVETTGFKNGDRMYIYYSDLNSGQLYWANSEEGDGGYTFDTTQTEAIQIDGGKLESAFMAQKCIPELNTTIWGWLDEMSEELSEVEALNSQIFDYTESQNEWETEETDLKAQISALTKERDDALLANTTSGGANDAQIQKYDDFFTTFGDRLTQSVNTLNSTLGSNEAEDEVEDDTSNFSGNDPFKYKKNNY